MSTLAVTVAGLLVGFAGPGVAGPSAPHGGHPAGSRVQTEPGDVRTVSTEWTTPWGLSWLPDGSALISERETFKIFKLTQDGAKTLVGSVPDSATTGAEDGVLGIAVSPNWDEDHYLYILHTTGTDNRVARMTYDGSTLGGYTTLLTGIRKNRIHNGGRLKFGPDGYLYAATGDSNQRPLAQDKDSLNGKILRMTAEGEPAPGNPFGTHVYSLGHRNPEGLAWDAQGRLWASEIGADTSDELNLIEPGKNYGWPTCEGPCDTEGMTGPKAHWPVAEASPSGLAYADGNLYMAAMRGRRLWRIPVDGTEAGTPVAYFKGTYGRLRTVEKVPGKNVLWVSTTNTDRNGGKPDGSDQVLEVELTTPAD
ncbi:PQQ-dependent sugar dehydrogenase [Streptomyces sp. NPDC006283]|uniref:PQQ-dependent sugar dehydrogenase n=1 Tax=Streptomyces sp. NPDC006283 TaxID=3156741 RepID=UPI0033A4A1A1